MTSGRCVVVGDVMMDVTARISSPIAYASDTPARISTQPGGSAATTAAWLAFAGHPVTFVGRVGDDSFGRTCIDRLATLGVDVATGVPSARATGTCVVIVDAGGERTMFPDSGANGDLDVAAVPSLGLGPGDHLHLSGYTLLNPDCRAAGMAALSAARVAGATTSLDPASAGPLAAARDVVLGILPLVDVLIANEDEARVLTGCESAQEALRALGARVPVAVVKRGAEGVLACAGSDEFAVAAEPAEVVDTTGAGDAFAAGFLAARRDGLPLELALAAGTALAARAVSRVGAGPPPD